MRYFRYGSMQDRAVRDTHYIVAATAKGGNKLGVLEKQVGFPNLGIRRDISYVQTKIKQGTWGEVPTSYSKAGKAAGLLCVSTSGSGQSTTTTMWYQIGMDSDGKAFAELGWQVGSLIGGNDSTFRYKSDSNKVKLWSSRNR